MKPLAFIIDDEVEDREVLKTILSEDFDFIEADDGETAIRIIQSNQYDIAVVLLNIILPTVSGLDVLQYLHRNNLNKYIPAIVISSKNSSSLCDQCFDFGAFDFIKKPFEKNRVKRRIKNAYELYVYKTTLEQKVQEQTKELLIQNKKLQKMNYDIIDSLGSLVEARNLESGQHVKRVKEYTKILATDVMKTYPEYGLTEHDVDMISIVSVLHDVGKIMISDAVLLQPNQFTPEEYELMKTHTTKGCEILEQAIGDWGQEYKDYAYEVIRYHHERDDGSGYPDGLIGDDIPISAQIVAIADVFDALTTDRVYKKAFPPDVALKMLVNGDCGAYSDKMKESLKRCFDDIMTKYLESKPSKTE